MVILVLLLVSLFLNIFIFFKWNDAKYWKLYLENKNRNYFNSINYKQNLINQLRDVIKKMENKNINIKKRRITK